MILARAALPLLAGSLALACVDPPLEGSAPPRPSSPSLAGSFPTALPSAPGAPSASVGVSCHETCSPPELPPPADVPAPGPHSDDEDAPGACPPEMVLIHGDYCLNARQDCLEWMDQELPLASRKRCARFAPSKCQGERKHMRFCIDRLEQAKAPDAIPIGDVSWTVAREQCEAQGKRLCFEQEWIFACEGPEMWPYPYGHERNAKLCNFDRTDLVERGKMVDHRHPATQHPGCKSPFGVMNMVGNVDEWVWLEKGHPPQRSGMKGGWWLAGRNRCRPVTAGHDEYFHEVQAGFRCCKGAG